MELSLNINSYYYNMGKQRVLGLDPGTNSLGWAVVEKNEDNTYTLIKKGVLRFDAGADEKGNTLAAARRLVRGVR